MKWNNIIKCKNCGKDFIKKSYQHKFCSNKGRENCKDKFHNVALDIEAELDSYNYASRLNELGWDGHKNSF